MPAAGRGLQPPTHSRTPKTGATAVKTEEDSNGTDGRRLAPGGLTVHEEERNTATGLSPRAQAPASRGRGAEGRAGDRHRAPPLLTSVPELLGVGLTPVNGLSSGARPLSTPSTSLARACQLQTGPEPRDVRGVERRRLTPKPSRLERWGLNCRLDCCH